jgi:hypothetical protein
MLRRYQTRIMAPSCSVRGMPAASVSPFPSAGDDGAAAAAVRVLAATPAGSRGEGSVRSPPQMPRGSTAAPAPATGHRQEDDDGEKGGEANATWRVGSVGVADGRRDAAQAPDDEAFAVVAAIPCISPRSPSPVSRFSGLPLSSVFLDYSKRQDCSGNGHESPAGLARFLEGRGEGAAAIYVAGDDEEKLEWERDGTAAKINATGREAWTGP